ncbi:endonuclease V-like isoform X1 [Dendronephthya gigantea]|uniref:endonuclease V-like isoform X1 n=1 Tax=Dendronephthya gigantea TaxID=151771 RepID=UPI00106CB788|nr:endonuclease V-like isoform X1 [Dendronephthya gigantea]
MENEDDLNVIKQQWIREQCELKKNLIEEDTYNWFQKDPNGEEEILLNYVGGVDISFVKGDEKHACAALVILSYPKLEIVYEEYDFVHLTSPYIPQFLAFREASFLNDLITKLKKNKPELLPEVIFVDGNGILHPRGFGVASHLGVISNTCTIGVGKTLFHVDGIEKNRKHLEKINQLQRAGDSFKLVGNSGKTFGAAFKSTDASRNPIYISIGHKISLGSALRICGLCCKHRVPEPIRQADIRSREFLRQNYETMVTKCCANEEQLGSHGAKNDATDCDSEGGWWSWCQIL